MPQEKNPYQAPNSLPERQPQRLRKGGWSKFFFWAGVVSVIGALNGPLDEGNVPDIPAVRRGYLTAVIGIPTICFVIALVLRLRTKRN